MATSPARTVTVSVTREIDAPAERVWSLLVDWERQSAWMPATTVRLLPGPREGVGTRLDATTGVGPLRLRDQMEIVGWEPPRRCVVRHLSPPLRGTGTFEAEALPSDRCRFTWREDIESPPGPLAATHTVLGALARPFFVLALRRLERLAR